MPTNKFSIALKKIERKDFKSIEVSLTAILDYSKKHNFFQFKKIKDTKKIIIKRGCIVPDLLLGSLFDCCYNKYQKPQLIFTPTIRKILERNML